MDTKCSFTDSLRFWGIGDTATAAKQLAGAGLGDEQAIKAALDAGRFNDEALAQVRALAPNIAQQFPALAQAVGFRA